MAVTSCENKSLNRQLDDLDTFMRVNPDSVYAVLDSMDTRQMSKRQRMRHALLLADAQNKAYIDFTTDSAMLLVADYYDHHGTPNEQMRAHYLLGCTYRDMGDVPMELQSFLEATEKADTASRDCDLYTLYAIYGQMADIYHSQFLPQEELKALAMCEEIAKKDGDTLSAIKAFELNIRPYYLLNEVDSVLRITKLAHEKYIVEGRLDLAAKILMPAIHLSTERKLYVLADEYLKEFEKQSMLIKQNGEVLVQAVPYLLDKGLLLLEQDDVTAAYQSFNLLHEYGYDELYYRGMLSLYEKTGNPDSIAKYATLFANANDSAFINTNSQTIEQMAAMYNYSRHKRIAEIQTERNAQAEERILILSFSLAIIILLFIIAIATIKHRNNVQKRKEENRIHTITKLYNSINRQLEQAKEQKTDIEEKLYRLQNKNDELILSYNNKLSKLQNEIDCLQEKVIKYKRSYTGIEFNAWLENFLDNDTVYSIKALVSELGKGHRTVATEKEWKALNNHFANNANSFYLHITNNKYQLTPIDIRVIWLAVLGMTTSDMALILDKSANHVTNTRKRILKKLFANEKNSRELRKEMLLLLSTSLEKQ